MSIPKTISDLAILAQTELPGESAHELMMPLKRQRSSVAKSQAVEYRESAVSIVLHPYQNQLRCILIQRPQYDGAHSGQVSFPGGKRDPEDVSLLDTAIRECREEIALRLHESQLIATLTEVFIPVSKFLVQPYVFFVENLSELIADEREVDEIFTFDTQLLLQPETRQMTNIRINSSLTLKDVPYFLIENRIVWGATALMLAEFKALLEKID